jgi:16S rRNA (cytosine1402-N4)-methyltransferase
MYHNPVLLKECIEGLDIKQEGIYVDATFGGGGHSREIAKHLTNGTLIVFDQDKDAFSNIEQQSKNIKTIHANFRYMRRMLNEQGFTKVDGILADLGVSSHQIDTPERGFSTRFNAQLDMRMDKNSSTTAAEIVNTYPVALLQKIFSAYGEITNAGTLARTIGEARQHKKILTTSDLVIAIEHCVPKHGTNKYMAQLFQSLRIEVNQEIEALKDILRQSVQVLNEGGRLVVISYHSLEDRLVKNFTRYGNFEGIPDKDMYGRDICPLKPITKKPIEPTEEEIEKNSRARSAKLRIAEKISMAA